MSLARYLVRDVSHTVRRGPQLASQFSLFKIPCWRKNLSECTARKRISSKASPTQVLELAAVQAGDGSDKMTGDGHVVKAYIDFKFVRDNTDLVAQNCVARASSADPHEVARLYGEFLDLSQQVDKIRATRNENSAAMKKKLEAGERETLIARGKELKEMLDVLESKLADLEMALQREGQKLPNMTHPDVPVGGEDVATVLSEVGLPRAFDTFKPLDHLALGEQLDVIDFETGASVAGTKFYYLKREAALLELALVNWAMQKVVARGFIPMITPDLVRESVFEKCGFQPRATNTQIYGIRDSSLCLTGTAEIPLGGVYMDKILNGSELPIKMAAFGHCFRTEAGAAGAAGKGLYRVHQFSKVEMFVVCTPEQSDAMHKELLDIEVEMFSELGLHFKVLDMPTADLGAPAYRKYDIEAWMPGMERYGEISSASNCTDYQSRRLNIRFRPEESRDGSSDRKKKTPTQFVHTLNGTACAVPRMVVAILENFQQDDGSVVIPEVLRPYMMGIDVIRRPSR